LQGLEKGGLTGITSSGTLGDDNGSRGEGTDTSRGGTSVGFEDLTDRTKVAIGKDETDVSTARIDELIHIGLRVGFDVLTHALAHHGVLSHENLSLSAEGLTGYLELLRANIVDFDNEALRVSSQEFLEPFKVLGLAFSGKRHDKIS
jgi:hypothetical protein